MIKPFQFTQNIRYQDLTFGRFQGVDFSSYASEVAPQRSPDAYNIVGTQNEIIEKRTGVKTEFTSAQIDSAFDTMWHPIYDAQQALVSEVYKNPYTYRTYPVLNMYKDENTWLIQKNGYVYYYKDNLWHRVKRSVVDMNVSRINKAFFKRISSDKILLYGGGVEYLLTVNLSTKVVTAQYTHDVAYIPTTSIANKWTGGGKFFEPINLVTWMRKNSFRVDETDYLQAITLKLDASSIDSDSVKLEYTYQNSAVDYVDILNFTWNENQVIELVPSGTYYRYTVDRWKGLIQFFECTIGGTNIAPAPFPLSVLGDFIPVEDNIVVTFGKGKSTFVYSSSSSLRDDNSESGNSLYNIKSILSFTWTSITFGFNNSEDYLFVSNGSNKDNWGRLQDLYFSDLDYAFLGNSGQITGYSVVDGKLIAHMQNEPDMTSMFVRNIDVSDDGQVFLTSTFGIKGINAVAREGFSSLEGQSLFLSQDGVYAVITSNVTNVNNITNRSYFVEKKMLAHASLKDARMINNDGFLYVWIGTECYVADSRKKSNQRDDFSDSFQYEWYYWKDLPVIRSLHVEDNLLWFTTESGTIGRFKKRTEIDAYEDDGVPVKVRWTSPVLFMNNITELKTLKNLWTKVGMFESPSSIKIFYRVGGNESLITFEDFQEFRFDNIDFTNFTFNTDTTPPVIVTNRTVRKFMNIQFSFENDANQPFGLIEFALKYRTNSQYRGG